MSLWTSLSIGRQALSVSQLGLQITSQNVANVNTQGYKRQRLDQAMTIGFSDQVTRLFGSNQPLLAAGRNLGRIRDWQAGDAHGCPIGHYGG